MCQDFFKQITENDLVKLEHALCRSGFWQEFLSLLLHSRMSSMQFLRNSWKVTAQPTNINFFFKLATWLRLFLGFAVPIQSIFQKDKGTQCNYAEFAADLAQLKKAGCTALPSQSKWINPFMHHSGCLAHSKATSIYFFPLEVNKQNSVYRLPSAIFIPLATWNGGHWGHSGKIHKKISQNTFRGWLTLCCFWSECVCVCRCACTRTHVPARYFLEASRFH